jgi:hypothetical protein
MFRWYRNAARCYVYLPDVSAPLSGTDEKVNPLVWESQFEAKLDIRETIDTAVGFSISYSWLPSVIAEIVLDIQRAVALLSLTLLLIIGCGKHTSSEFPRN